MPLPPPPSSQPVLRKGSRGAAVVDLQKRLAAAGYSCGGSDGQFGGMTDKAVKAFQSANGLTPDGVVGPVAWTALNRSAPVDGPTDPPDTFEPSKATWDVATTTPAEIAALKASSDPATRRLGNTIAGAKLNYADRLATGARIVVTTSKGNGGQPVLVLVPEGFDPSQPARVHTHYHGWNATIVDALGHSAGTAGRMAQIQAADPQTVFVLPECGNAPAVKSSGGTPEFQTNWSNVSGQALTTKDALASAGITNVGTRVVSAHSGGGVALANSINASPDGSGLDCDRLELQDCLYGCQAQIKTWSKTELGQAAQQVTYYHGTNDGSADAGFGKAFGDRYRRINVDKMSMTSADRPILDDATGKSTGKPAYSADPHNRTVGQFMDDLGHDGFDQGISGRG